jgi:hypothetical protein
VAGGAKRTLNGTRAEGDAAVGSTDCRSGIKEDMVAKIKVKGNNAPVIRARPTAIIESRDNSEKVADSELAGEFSRSARLDGRKAGSRGRGGGGGEKRWCGRRH